MARKPKLEKLTISLLKQGSTREAVLREPSAYTSHTVAAIDPSQPSLFVSANLPHAPRWAKYLEGQVSPALSGLVTASSSAVLLIEANERLFAITFGQGRYMVEDEALERDFGLRVVLNAVAPDQLKSVNAKTIEETTVHTRRDVSRESNFLGVRARRQPRSAASSDRHSPRRDFGPPAHWGRLPWGHDSRATERTS